MNNTYIQNKLDEFDKQFVVGEPNLEYISAKKEIIDIKNFLEQSLTDYHNHIVEKFKEKYKFSSSTTLFEILSLLQDTNKE